MIENLHKKIAEGIKQSAYIAVREARFHGTEIISYENGEITRTDPNTIIIPENNQKTTNGTCSHSNPL